MAVPVDRFATSGVSVVAGEDRRGSRLVSHYRVGRHSVVWIDPEVAGALHDWHGAAESVSLADFRRWSLARNAVSLGRGLEHVLPGRFESPPRRPAVRVLDGSDPSVARFVRDLIDVCSDDDRDEADFDPDALDPHLVGWCDDGALLAVAGGRPFDARPGFLDVGVLVHPKARRSGLGRAVIAGVVDEVIAADGRPLYRCGRHNEGSQRLCRGLGFVQVVELEAFRWPAAS